MNDETDLISIRVSKKTKKLIAAECGQKGISLNKLINQVLEGYVQFDLIYRKMDVISVPKIIYKAFIDKITIDEIKTISRTEGIRAMKNYYLFTNTIPTIETLLENLIFWLKTNNILFHHHKIDRHHKLTIQHNLGKNFGMFFYTTVSVITEEIGHKTSIIHLAEDILVLTIGDINKTIT